jgi:hypothetical protein
MIHNTDNKCKNSFRFKQGSLSTPFSRNEVLHGHDEQIVPACACAGLLKKEQNSELDEEEENFEEAVRAVNTVITHTR